MQYNNIKKYLFEYILLYIVYISVLVGVYIGFGLWMVLIASIILWAPLRLFVRLIVRNTIESILTKELDAPKFKNVISSYKWLKPPILYTIIAEYYNGNYYKAKQILEKALQKTKNKKERGLFLCVMSRIYFETDDIDNLICMCDYVEMHKNELIIPENSGVFGFYRDYAEKRYLSCYDFCKDVQEKLNGKSFQYKLLLSNNLFNCAVVYYKLKDWDMAKKYFSKLIDFAPRLYISKVADEYLSAIESNKEFRIEIINPNNEENYIIPQQRFQRKTLLICVYIILLLLLLLLNIKSIVKNHTNSKDIDEFDKKIDCALQTEYEKYKYISSFNLSKKQEVTDVFCIVEDEKGKCDIGFIVTYDGGNTFDFVCAVDDVEQGGHYVVKSITGMHYIAIDVGLKSETEKNNYNKKVNLTVDGSEVSVGFVYLSGTDF